jgi:5-oxoprolinase (ATP-hydrolysing) subunit A
MVEARMLRVDLNCDMGESFGAWAMGADAAILPHVTSVNIACGFHAGDPSVMRATVQSAAALGLAIGAHPGLPDLLGFGRRIMSVSPTEAYDMVVYQVGALQAVARAAGATLQHVKPHGALYNMAAADDALADAIARAVKDVDATLVLVGLSGSVSIDAGIRHGLRTAREVFADRNYRANGSLVPRSSPGALVTDVDAAVARALRMVRSGRVTASDGTDLTVVADTICIHGDAPGAAAFAQHIRSALHADGVAVLAPGAVIHS